MPDWICVRALSSLCSATQVLERWHLGKVHSAVHPGLLWTLVSSSAGSKSTTIASSLPRISLWISRGHLKIEHVQKWTQHLPLKNLLSKAPFFGKWHFYFFNLFKQLTIILICPSALCHEVTKSWLDIFQTSPLLFISTHHYRPCCYQPPPGTTGVSWLILLHLFWFWVISHITVREIVSVFCFICFLKLTDMWSCHLFITQSCFS